MRSRARLAVVSSIALALAACGKDDDAASPQQKVDAGDPTDFAHPPESCIYQCPTPSADECPEVEKGYACPSLGAWAAIPHADACGTWDGAHPEPVAGTCTSTAPTGEAAKYTGVEPDGTKILPDGRRVKPAGAEWAFPEKDPMGLPSFILPIPGKRWVVTVDTGEGPHAVRAIDVDKIGSGDPVLGMVRFDAPKTLNSSVAFRAPDLLWVATSDGVIQALTLDPATGALAKDDARTITLPPSVRDGKEIPWHVASVAVSPDGSRLIAGAVLETNLLVFDADPASPGFKSELARVDLGASETFAAAFDPNDPEGRHAYVSLWGAGKVAEVDVSATPKLVRAFAVDKDPQGLAFLDARWMAVANSFGDTISLVDRVAGSVTRVPVDVKPELHGFDPSSVAWDAPRKRLYATLAGLNAIGAWDVDVSGATPTITPAGRIPTGWWPGGVTTLDDGTLAIANMRAAYLGPLDEKFLFNDGDARRAKQGSIQRVPAPSAADLLAGEAAVKAAIDVAGLSGSPTVECPAGAAYDFPVPRTNTEGPSKAITHVFFVVRENKTFDGILGDLPGVEGDPKLILAKDSADQEKVWANFRALARQFTVSDNYYTDAELSQQGHFWTVYGRSSDFNERTWAVDGYSRNIRNRPLPVGGVLDIGQPAEGSSFDWLGRGGVDYEIFGEALGLPAPKPGAKNPLDLQYPGGFVQSIGYPDTEKACYLAGRARVLCDAPAFGYVTLPNDHTHGISASSPLPDAMMAVNDEATGILVEAISQSPLWASSLIVITEDDPANGGEHVDIHRTPLVLISPWVKRGYVSKTHVDVASLHKLFAHLFGLPYPNVQVEHASIPFDAFTSTPDYAPYAHAQLSWPIACGGSAPAAEHFLTSSFDLSLDESPGLMRQVERWMKGQPYVTLPPAVERAARERLARKASGAEIEEEDDDD